jgi:hypothetical protein
VILIKYIQPLKTMVLKNKYCLIVLFLGISVSSVGQSSMKIYKLKSITNNADFDYKRLRTFDENIEIKDIQKALKPLENGKFTVYEFLATYKGKEHWVPDGQSSLDSLPKYKVDRNGYRILTKEEMKKINKYVTFHNTLIIKTNSKNEIIDAYRYFLEWADVFPSDELYRSSAKNLKFMDGLSIQKLKFYRVRENFSPEFLNEKGIIKLK